MENDPDAAKNGDNQIHFVAEGVKITLRSVGYHLHTDFNNKNTGEY